ncbi:MAG TPA: M14 family metallopeptidase [Steroidobacteraceae bacterium]|nr:M14 family metallopeptidase [Steroidobacteraceae bacterium]
MIPAVARAALVALALSRLPVVAPAASAGQAGAGTPLSTGNLRSTGELSAYTRTGRYDEVERLCRAYAARWPRQLRCAEFGRTPEGRPMLALVASADGTLSPAQARARHRPVLLFQGGIHAGEIDGKDAGLLALRELLDGNAQPGVLGKITVVFVPVYNVDGHERFGRWHRPNQRGPEESGWRTTAQNLNLNRDYTKADAPETRAMLGLLDAWDPILYVDLHVTDGAQFQPDISVQLEPCDGWDHELGIAGCAVRDAVLADLERQGYIALPFYPSFVRDDEPESGFSVSVSNPRYSTSYWATRNRFSALVETHSWKPYARRVAATHAAILAMVGLAARDGKTWLADASTADERASRLAGQPVALSYKNSDATRTIEFPGYAYSREPSPISGQSWIRYDESSPQVWRVPLLYEVVPDLEIVAPAQGYVVPVAYAAWMSDRLKLHGIRYEVLDRPQPQLAVQVFRADSVKQDDESFEGHVGVHVTGAWSDEARDVPAGSLFVPIAQPGARLVMSLLEPQAPDSYVSWGYFDASFEQKEYMENYVAEAVARDMLARDAGLRAEFEQRLATDPAFAADPDARLDFFRRRHPSWDDRYDLYPVYRR